MDLAVSETAVLGLHWQRDVVAADGKLAPMFSAMAEATGVVGRASRLLDAARKAGRPVVFTRICFRPGYPDVIPGDPLMSGLKAIGALVEGERGADILPELAPRDGDVVVDHRRISGFFGSDLDTVLKASGVATVVLTGVATNVSVLATSFDAAALGYRTIVASDCCSAADEQAHDAALRTIEVFAEVAASDELLSALS